MDIINKELLKKNKNPFTKGEKKIMNTLIKAHNEFSKLEKTHPNEMNDWLCAFHKLQDLLGSRVLRRDYPNIFYSIKKNK